MARVPVEVLEELIADAAATRVEKEAVLRDLAAEVAELRQEEDALQAALNRRRAERAIAGGVSLNGHSEGPDEEQLAVDSWATLNRTDAVERAIAGVTLFKKWANPGDIEGVLKARGRNDTRDEIGGATSYLRRQGRIRSLGRGQWVVGSEKASEDTVGAVPSESVPTSEERRTDDAEAGADYHHIPGRHNGDGGNPPSLVE
jgi:hypothetical protein